jgi:hypothetical protein
LLEDIDRRKAVVATVGLGFEVDESPCNFHYTGLMKTAQPTLTQ